MTKALQIRGESYVEAKPTTPLHPTYGSCAQCAFGQSSRLCTEAVKAAPSIFGGDCESRAVVYVRAEA